MFPCRDRFNSFNDHESDQYAFAAFACREEAYSPANHRQSQGLWIVTLIPICACRWFINNQAFSFILQQDSAKVDAIFCSFILQCLQSDTLLQPHGEGKARLRANFLVLSCPLRTYHCRICQGKQSRKTRLWTTMAWGSSTTSPLLLWYLVCFVSSLFGLD